MSENSFKQKFTAAMTAVGKALLGFAKANYLMCAYVVASLLIELTGIAVTSGGFYMSQPWLYLSLIATMCLVSQYLPGNKSRYSVFLSALIINFVIDFIFIVVYDSTGGTVFDYAMLDLRNDAMVIVEVIPMSFTFVFVSALTIVLYGTLGFKLIKRMPAPNVPRSAKITTAALIALVMTANALVSYIGNYRYDSNDLDYKLYQPESGTYSNKGIVGNFYNELVRGLWFSEIDVGDRRELNDFIYRSVTSPTPYTGRAAGFNSVTILCESFEWFTFLYDEEIYPNGYAKDAAEKTPDEIAKLKADLKTLFPNFYRMYEDNSTVILNNSYSLEKTDISENKAILGNYPISQYINYKYPYNSLPYSLPNMLKTLYGVESNSFHNGLNTFYNRNIHHVNALGFNSFTSSEEMYDKTNEGGGGLGEQNLDSIMFDTCKARMFPTDRRFNTFITTITQHGQYAERENLADNYAKMDELGILPIIEGDDDHNNLRYYCAAGMDTDKAIGIMLDYLEENGLADKTLITMYGDHNAYYQGISNYVKDIYSDSAANYTELYRVPVMIKVGELGLGNPHIDKFTCVSDIYPTILDLLGITTFSNLTYGVSAFSDQSSLLYSRAYGKFITDKICFISMDNISYLAPDEDESYIAEIERKAKLLLDKISHVNRIFAADYFNGEVGDEFNAVIKQINEPALD